MRAFDLGMRRSSVEPQNRECILSTHALDKLGHDVGTVLMHALSTLAPTAPRWRCGLRARQSERQVGPHPGPVYRAQVLLEDAGSPLCKLFRR